MSNEKPEGMIDFSNYDGDYQEGELLGEDGEAIDMEDLKGDNPPRVPLVMKLLFVLLCVSVGAVGYWTFILKAPPPAPPPRPVEVKRNKTLDTTLTKIEDIRKKSFNPLARCWNVLAHHQTKKKAATAAILAKHCPALKAGAVQYKPQCSDATCTKVLLASCKGAACTPVADTHYIDLIQMLMLRVADGYNRLMAALRLYESALEQQKRAKKGKGDTAAIDGVVKKHETQVKGILDSKGAWHQSHFGLSKAQLYAQAIAHLQSLKPKAATDEPKKKKKRRRRRRRRRKKKAKKAAGADTLWGGTLYGDAKWPIAGLDKSNYQPVDKRKLEFGPDEVPATIESRADSLGVKGQLTYSAATTQFWTFMLLQNQFHRCAAKHAKGKSYTATFTSLVQSEGGRFYNNGTKVEVVPPSAAVASCLSETIRTNRVTFGYRALPPEPKRVTIKFKVVLKP